MYTAGGSKLARRRPDVALMAGRKPMAIVAQASRRNYAMAAEDANKGVVG